MLSPSAFGTTNLSTQYFLFYSTRSVYMPKNCSCPFLMVLSRDSLYPAIFITSWFDFFSVHGILIVLLIYRVSAASCRANYTYRQEQNVCCFHQHISAIRFKPSGDGLILHQKYHGSTMLALLLLQTVLFMPLGKFHRHFSAWFRVLYRQIYLFKSKSKMTLGRELAFLKCLFVFVFFSFFFFFFLGGGDNDFLCCFIWRLFQCSVLDLIEEREKNGNIVEVHLLDRTAEKHSKFKRKRALRRPYDTVVKSQ